MTGVWPWKITPVLASIYSAPFLSYGVGSLYAAAQSTWAEIRIAVHASQEMQARAVQYLGHCFVGRQHELFDDLMALGVLHHVGAAHKWEEKLKGGDVK